jgi:hypothetical protein
MQRFTITKRQRAPTYKQLCRHLTKLDDVRAFAVADPEELRAAEGSDRRCVDRQ